MTALTAEQLSLLDFGVLQALLQQLDQLLTCPYADLTSLFRDWFAESQFREPVDTRADRPSLLRH
jgi:hypothetical protein